MKKLRIISAALILFTAAAFTSCNDDDAQPANTNPGTTDEPYVKAKVNGTSVMFNEVYRVVADGKVTVTAYNTNNAQQNIQFVVPANIPTGEYPIGNNIDEEVVMAYNGPAISVLSQAGVFTVTETGAGWFNGTFGFTGQSTQGQEIAVTEGEYHVAQ